MKTFPRICAAVTLVLAAFLFCGSAWAQGTVLQSGPITPGHVPMYLPGGGLGQATLFDSGPAGGAAIGYGLSEKLLQARTAPGGGSGPFGSHDCDWDTYMSNPAGSHFLCWDANASGAGLLAVGPVGIATPQGLNFLVDGGNPVHFSAAGTGLLGFDTAPNPPPNSDSNQIATTQFVNQAIGGSGTAQLAWVGTNAALEAVSTATTTRVMRCGVNTVGDAPCIVFLASPSACTITNGDIGSQVPSADAKCWVTSYIASTADIREWGQSTLNFYVSSIGNDFGGANFCAIQTTPCLTLSNAVQHVALFSWNIPPNNAQINVLTGTFAGASIAGHFLNASGSNREPCLFIVGAGDATTGTPTHITNDLTGGTQVWDIEVSGNACVVPENLDFVIPANDYGFFAQDGGTHVLPEHVSCTGPSGGTEAQVCGHAEGGAYIEFPASSNKITVQGKFAWKWTVGEAPGKITFDPGGSGLLSCGSGLIMDPAGGEMLVDASAVSIMSGWTWDGSCAGVLGHPVVAEHNSFVNNGTGMPFPNVGSFRILDTSVVTPNPLPGLSSCANGTIVNGGGTNANNNSFQVLFSGANSSCTIEFGSFLTNQFWFTNTPICMVSGSNQLKGLGVSYPLNGVTVVPQSAFGADDTLNVYCPAPAQG